MLIGEHDVDLGIVFDGKTITQRRYMGGTKSEEERDLKRMQRKVQAGADIWERVERNWKGNC